MLTDHDAASRLAVDEILQGKEAQYGLAVARGNVKIGADLKVARIIFPFVAALIANKRKEVLCVPAFRES